MRYYLIAKVRFLRPPLSAIPTREREPKVSWPPGGVMKEDHPFPPDILKDKGLCNRLDLRTKERFQIFYPDDGGNYREAISICVDCPVRKQCAEWAVETIEYGCWGGLTEQNRKIIRRNRSMPTPWPTDLKHGQGRDSFKAHLRRGEIPCDDCYKGRPKNDAYNINRKAKVGRPNENGRC